MVQIITDSSTLYTVEEAKKLGFEALPLCVSIGDLEGRDLQVDMRDFYGRIEKGEIPKSSQPPIGEALELYEKYSEDEESFLIPQDFDFLRRGGRLTPMAAALGSVLKLKPIMTLTEDCKKLDKFEIKRTMKAAVKTVIAHLKAKELNARHILYVSHAEALEDAKNVVANLKEVFKDVEIQMLDLGAAFVTQGGPKCVAIQYIEK